VSRPVTVCYGTRPQIIKASRVLAALRSRGPVRAVDTGQHYDHALHQVFYEQLGVHPPDRFLEVGSGSHAVQTAAILTRAAEEFAAAPPRAVVVIGDTNSTLGCALAAVQRRLPVVHVEAGLRAADAFMAEEINRRVVDAVSSLLCAPSASAGARLRAESVSGRVVITGDVARDVLLANLARVPALPPSWPVAPGGRFAFATLHRAELTDHPDRLAAVLAGLAALELPVVLPAHPRTRAAIAALGPAHRPGPRVHLLEPVGYLESLAAVQRAEIVITDSGGIQREAYWLGTPCVTVRAETEWVETVALGANEVVPPERAEASLPATVARRLDGGARRWDRDAYGDGAAAERIAEAVGALLA
jgi:UDP-N-acetylglucosamine 2-epimerase